MKTAKKESPCLYILSYYTYQDEKTFVAGLRPYKLWHFLLENDVNVKLITPKKYSGDEIVVEEGWFLKLLFFFSRLLPPDATVLWSIKVFFKIIFPNKKKDFLILTSLPPNGIGLCGLLCKWFNMNVTWIVDFRDLWIDHPLYNPPLTKRYLDPLLEKSYIEKSDLLICNTNWDKDYFSRKFNLSKSKKIVIRNGFDVAEKNISITNSEKFRFIYAGGTTAGQATLIIIKLLEEINLIGYDAHCDFYGEYDENMNTSKYITYHGKIGPDEIPSILVNYKYGFIYLPKNSESGGRVAQKFYDYLGTGVIPVCFRASVEMRELMQELNTGITIGENSEVSAVINELLTAEFSANNEQIKYFSRNDQFNLFLNEVSKFL